MTATRVASIGERWKGWAAIVSSIVALLALLGVSTILYNEVWQSKRLVYTIIPRYDLQDRFSNGIMIENRGRVALTDVQIIIGGLGMPIDVIQIPEPHQPATIIDGGEGYDHVRIDMPRLSPDYALTVFVETDAAVSLDANRNFIITSAETTGKPLSEFRLTMPSSMWVVILTISGMVLLAVILALLFFRGDKEETRM